MRKREIADVIRFYMRDDDIGVHDAARVLRAMHITETHSLRSALGRAEGQVKRAQRRVDSAQSTVRAISLEFERGFDPYRQALNEMSKDNANLRYRIQALEQRIEELEGQ